MSCLTRNQEATVERIYNSFGGSVPCILIALFVKLSVPARTSLRLALTQMKTSLQAQINSLTIQNLRASVIEQKMLTNLNTVSTLLNQSKNSINLLNTGICVAEDLDDPAIQKLVKIVTGKMPTLPSINFGGFDAINATVESLTYEINRVRKAVDLSQNGLKMLNEKINTINEYITIIDAI